MNGKLPRPRITTVSRLSESRWGYVELWDQFLRFFALLGEMWFFMTLGTLVTFGTIGTGRGWWSRRHSDGRTNPEVVVWSGR